MLPTIEELKSTLGKIVCTHESWRVPDIYIIVGWTKNAESINVMHRMVKIKSIPEEFITDNYHVESNSGDWSLDMKQVRELSANVLKQDPVKAKGDRTIGIHKHKDGALYLGSGDHTLHIYDNIEDSGCGCYTCRD